MADHGGYGGHEDGAQPSGGRFDDSLEFGETVFAEAVGEFHDEDGVFGNEADQRDEAHLAVDVEGGEAEEGEEEGAGERERD